MLLKHTKQQTTDFAVRQLKLGCLLGAYGINRIGIDLLFCSNSIFGLSPGNPLEVTLHMTVVNSSWFLSYKSTMSYLNFPLQIWLAFLTMPSSTTLIRSRKARHTMLDHCRPPDHKRKLQSESWRVETTVISPLVSYRPCVTYSFVPFSLPDLWIPYHLAYIRSFALLTAVIRFSGPGSTTTTQAPFRWSYRLP